ncbi:uncharacterized protein [Gossypium hirsutum]|uniref:RNase H type-1 domain-containing protein n=1 Tax=Gossypium hirsutum TaxID=3635 RepID=A0A1U8MQ64_GOSHI|nr:uncharacterized protein LOC107940076 [Gossypium hirsutum]
MVNEDGSWNIDLFQVWLSDDVIQCIKGILPPYPSAGVDKISWSHTSNGGFSVKSAYRMLNEGDWKPKDKKWKSVWKLLGPHRVRIIAWFVKKDPVGLAFLDFMFGAYGRTVTFSFFKENLGARERLFKFFLSWTKQLFSILKVDAKRSFNCTIEEEPFEDPIFLTIDGAVQIETGNGAVGGIIHNANGDWILGYNRHLGKCSIFNAESWGSLEGLRRIQSILSLEIRWCLRYIPRDQNQVADCLAKQALSGPDILQVFDSPHR